MSSKKIVLGKKTIETQLPAFVMGIVNCTPDSFFSGSRGNHEESVAHALDMIEKGAHVLDIGGESTRPGSAYVSQEDEISRIIPVIREIRRHSSIPISVDTRKKAVMEAAFNEGADVLNDVSALEDDSEMAGFAAESGIGLILMHKRGIPSDMQSNTGYRNVFEEVSSYLERRAEYAVSKGVAPEKIIVDPGIGFGKDLESNATLISRCGELCGGRYPVLMALSRKTCIGEMTGKKTEDRLYGTLAADLISVMRGARMVRVHDVDACLDTLKVLKSLE